MKAKTLRPFLIVLLFGFLSASGWLTFSGGAHHASAPALLGANPRAGTAAHRPTAGSAGSAGQERPGSAVPSAAALYAQSAAPGTPLPAGTAPHGTSGDPASAAHRPAEPGAGPAILIAADDAYDPGVGFGELGSAGALPAADASNPRGGRPDSGGGSASGRSGGSGGSGGSSGSGASSLLDPPGATGGGSSAGGGGGGGDPAGSNGNHQVTVPEPSTLALFLAGTAALGFALRRRLSG